MPESLRILIADDDASMLRALTRFLEATGFTCFAFASAEEVLASSETMQAACIVTDIHLPGMSGMELVDQLRLKHGRMPAVFITGFGSPALQSEAMKRHQAAYLAKPFDPEALLQAIQKVTMLAGQL